MSDMESGERVRTKFALSEQLQELEDNGFWIFGGVASRKVRLGEEIANWRISVLRVLRADNSDIVKVGFDSSDMKSSEQPLAPDEKPNE
jgi:hypothetical protein